MSTRGANLWKRFLDIAKPYWLSREKWRAWALMLILICLLLGQTWTNVRFNEQTGEFASALAAGDADRFWYAIEIFVYVLIAAVPVYALFYYTRNRLFMQWRSWMTHHYLNKYFGGCAFYALNASTAIDNPDQRISEDISTFTQQSLYFLLLMLGSLLQLIAFSEVLWSISRELVVFLVLYAVCGTVVSVLCFGKVLIGLNFYQLKREADFRFSLIRVREHAESITFHRGEQHEFHHVRGRFLHVFANYNRLNRWQLNLYLFQYAYSFLTLMLPSVIVANRVLDGELEVGAAIQAAGAFAAVLAALTVIVDNFESLSRFVAGVDRLATFASTLAHTRVLRRKPGSQVQRRRGDTLSLQHLTLHTPDYDRTLLKDLTVTVGPGQSLLIVGPSGGGKSSLMRTISGLWNSGSGCIVHPEPEQMLILPQHPYMAVGNLRCQLLYPNHHERRTPDAELLKLLEMVNLPDLAERLGGLDAELDWGKVLSLGEQQRLAFARLLLARPRYALLDEATSALDAGNEARLYSQLAAGHTTIVSVSHRPTLLKYHVQVLELCGNGEWQLHPTNEYRFAW
ncbi:ABC transporter ATP-binding protein/permease [Cupriavidus sp. WKF15]|uniref:ABC transporter ATP-binding protein/permease n=1 Tax=Cupriavidus sp. WKF15 TaxID=3032282 RepID=UPI0023E21F42|nr:ABC transporter ATP-binding protein/permease [Cupriavidus sp. WKF15]WER48797.1 ABC transporter ATP-binding protein/permease [Cupriavidus sp. WKF15]